MLFLNQVKREFSQVAWKRGQTYFREDRVKDVRLKGNLVAAKVQGTDEAAYETAIVMARGTIFNSDCSCPAHRLYETHCKHVAALTVWIVERGSLLRAGILSEEDGVATEEELPEEHSGAEQYYVLRDADKALMDVRLRSLIRSHSALKDGKFILRRDQAAGFLKGMDKNERPFSIPITLPEVYALQEHCCKEEEKKEPPKGIQGEPVALVRGTYNNKVLQAISVEVGVRYRNPETGEMQVDPIQHLVRQSEPKLWRTIDGVYVKLTSEVLPVLTTIDAAKIIHQGPQALEQLAKLLTNPYREKIAFHKNLNVELDPEPLKLTTLNIGSKGEKSRSLTYEFSNPKIKINSEQLEQLSHLGKLGSQYVWIGEKLYKFETSLTSLARFANRSGVSTPETSQKDAFKPNGFTEIDDDDSHPLHPLAAYRLSLELGVENFNVDSDWTEFHEWKKTFEKKKIPALPKVEYGFDLREYQENGLNWMWSLYHRGLSALLADDMGLGKTHQVLALLSSIYRGRGKPKEPTLVIAPTSVVAAWSHKLQKYPTGLKYIIFHGKSRSLPSTGVDLVLTTYGILQKEEILRTKSWHVVILDEAQAIKNATTISSRASRALKSKYKIAMTGTPVENQSTDLWSVMEFLLPGYLGSLPRFKRLYGSGREAPSAYQASALKRLVSPFLLRRTKSQVLTELPEKTEEVMDCELTPIQKKVYKALLNGQEATRIRESLQDGTKKVDYASILGLLTRLKQVCDHPKLVDITAGKKKVAKVDPLETGKWETFDELLTEALGSNLKVVVFTQYLGMMDIIAHQLKLRGIGYTDLRGDTSDRAARLEKFAEDPECKVFICSLLAGGLGIDLTSASVCIHFDRWWNPAKENQATDRLHRFGQTRGVQVFKLQVPGTIEDRIASIIESKKALSGTLIEESPTGLKAFSRKELLQLFVDPAE